MNILTRRLIHTLNRCPRIHKRMQLTQAETQKRSNYEGPGKTTVSFLNEDSDNNLIVESYSQLGFRLSNGVFVVGPVALFPKSVLSWNVESMKDLTPKSLQLFFTLDPKIDILVLGMGDESVLDVRLMQEIKRLGLNVEALPTDRACTTFNFLNSEYRYVAAALIPPENVRTSYEDLYETSDKLDKLTWESMYDESLARDKLGDKDPRTQRLMDRVNQGYFEKRHKDTSSEKIENDVKNKK